MKWLMTLMMVMVVVVSVSTVEARHPTLRNHYGSRNPYGCGRGDYGRSFSYGYYGGRRYGDSDAGKMIAAGQLIRDIAGAATSLKSTWEAWELAQGEQEHRNQRRTQPTQVIYQTPSVNQEMTVENTNLRRENQMLRDRIKQEKVKEVQELKRKNEILGQELKDAEKKSQEKIQQTSSENQNLQEKIEELRKERHDLQEKQKLQKILDALEKELQELKVPADPNSTRIRFLGSSN